jgi:hypothetical protein
MNKFYYEKYLEEGYFWINDSVITDDNILSFGGNWQQLNFGNFTELLTYE